MKSNIKKNRGKIRFSDKIKRSVVMTAFALGLGASFGCSEGPSRTAECNKTAVQERFYRTGNSQRGEERGTKTAVQERFYPSNISCSVDNAKDSTRSLSTTEVEIRQKACTQEFFAAVTGGDIRRVNFLVSQGLVDVNAKDKKGKTALYYVAKKDSKIGDMAITLLRHGARTDLPMLDENNNKSTIAHELLKKLIVSSQIGSVIFLDIPDEKMGAYLTKLIIGNMENKKAKDEMGRNVLHIIAIGATFVPGDYYSWKKEVFFKAQVMRAILTEFGSEVDPNEKDNIGIPPLHYLFEFRYLHTNKDPLPSDKLYPISILAPILAPEPGMGLAKIISHLNSRIGMDNLFRDLKDKGVDLNATDEYGRNILHYLGNILEYLQERSNPDSMKVKALKDAIKAAIKNGVDPNQKDIYSNLPYIPDKIVKE